MKIAVVGAKGFVGNSLYEFLVNQHSVVPVSRENLDVLDPAAVQQFVEKNQFDVIINAAATMKDNFSLHDTRNNLGLFMNFHRCRLSFGKFINLGSGAEFDRTRNIHNAESNEIFQVVPTDSYGFGQNIKSRICFETDNFYTLRIFNCFGSGELETRLFPQFLSCGDTFSIQNDRYFDFFSIQDLCLVVEYFAITDNLLHKDINCVYQNKFLISEVIKKFSQIKNKSAKIVVDSTSNNNYTGNGDKLESLKLNLFGLEEGFKNYK